MHSPALAGAVPRVRYAESEMQPLRTTLYELVEAVAEFAANERELAVVVEHLLASHRARRSSVPRSALS